MCGTGIMRVQAAYESETAGSSFGKETATDEKAIRARNSSGWILDDAGWRYCYEDGTYPSESWRKIDEKWYYFDSRGYWIDDNSCENGSIKGIDVSSWQGEIDWKRVKEDGIEFAFIRAGHGLRTPDKYFQVNMEGANAADIPAGVYFYSTAQDEATAIKDAQFAIKSMEGYEVSYPVVIDLEDASQQELSKTEIGEIAKAYCDEIAKAGYTPMIYCNEYWYNNYIDASQLGNIEKWVARYNVTYSKSIPRGIWQSCCNGRVEGISGDVDINFAYKDYTEIVVPRTAPAEGYQYTEGKWVLNQKGWWYSYYEGGYPSNCWEQIEGVWYWFNSSGYMETGWQYISGQWYYLNASGAMQTGWILADGTWYYMDASGVMQTGWQCINELYYYLNSSGAMQTGWLYQDNQWFYLNASGVMQTGWIPISGKWYYMNEFGIMQTGWQYISGVYYYLDSSGAMQTGWLYQNNQWYYLNMSGAMVTGWQIVDGYYYYFYDDGRMASNTWIGSYYVDISGRWV